MIVGSAATEGQQSATKPACRRPIRRVHRLRPRAASPATFSEVFAVGEFRALWLAQILSVVGDQLARVALTLLVFDRTGSSLLAAVTYAASLIPLAIGGVALSGLADRLPRRGVMICCDLGCAVLVASMALPGVPIAGPDRAALPPGPRSARRSTPPGRRSTVTFWPVTAMSLASPSRSPPCSSPRCWVSPPAGPWSPTWGCAPPFWRTRRRSSSRQRSSGSGSGPARQPGLDRILTQWCDPGRFTAVRLTFTDPAIADADAVRLARRRSTTYQKVCRHRWQRSLAAERSRWG